MKDSQSTGDTATTRELVYDFLVQYKREHDGNTPTTREIAEGCCLSVSTVKYHLTRLEVENRIYITGDRRRNIEIMGGNWDLINGKEAVPDGADQSSHDSTPEHTPDSDDAARAH
jgi:SOS-response transcriptional repressor LexA